MQAFSHPATKYFLDEANCAVIVIHAVELYLQRKSSTELPKAQGSDTRGDAMNPSSYRDQSWYHKSLYVA